MMLTAPGIYWIEVSGFIGAVEVNDILEAHGTRQLSGLAFQ